MSHQSQHDATRRQFIKKIAYVPPAIMTLTAAPAFASVGSPRNCNQGVGAPVVNDGCQPGRSGEVLNNDDQPGGGVAGSPGAQQQHSNSPQTTSFFSSTGTPGNGKGKGPK